MADEHKVNGSNSLASPSAKTMRLDVGCDQSIEGVGVEIEKKSTLIDHNSLKFRKSINCLPDVLLARVVANLPLVDACRFRVLNKRIEAVMFTRFVALDFNESRLVYQMRERNLGELNFHEAMKSIIDTYGSRIEKLKIVWPNGFEVIWKKEIVRSVVELCKNLVELTLESSFGAEFGESELFYVDWLVELPKLKVLRASLSLRKSGKISTSRREVLDRILQMDEISSVIEANAFVTLASIVAVTGDSEPLNFIREINFDSGIRSKPDLAPFTALEGISVSHIQSFSVLPILSDSIKRLELAFGSRQFSSDGLQPFGKLVNLKELKLCTGDCQPGELPYFGFLKSLTNLDSIGVIFVENFDCHAAFVHIAPGAPLGHVDVRGCSQTVPSNLCGILKSRESGGLKSLSHDKVIPAYLPDLYELLAKNAGSLRFMNVSMGNQVAIKPGIKFIENLGDKLLVNLSALWIFNFGLTAGGIRLLLERRAAALVEEEMGRGGENDRGDDLMMILGLPMKLAKALDDEGDKQLQVDASVMLAY